MVGREGLLFFSIDRGLPIIEATRGANAMGKAWLPTVGALAKMLGFFGVMGSSGIFSSVRRSVTRYCHD